MWKSCWKVSGTLCGCEWAWHFCRGNRFQLLRTKNQFSIERGRGTILVNYLLRFKCSFVDSNLQEESLDNGLSLDKLVAHVMTADPDDQGQLQQTTDLGEMGRFNG